MNRKIGLYASLINVSSVFCFALSMLVDLSFGSYLSSIFIALSFGNCPLVLILCKDRKKQPVCLPSAFPWRTP